jgi:hypothetical protein
MRGRIVLLVVLAVVVALAGVFAGWSRNTSKAAGEPSTATPADSSVGSTEDRAAGSAPARSPTASSPKVSSPNASPPKVAPPKAPPKVAPPKVLPPKTPPPRTPPPKACSPTAVAQPAAYTTPSGQQPETEPASQLQPSADLVRFGPVATTPSDDTTDTSIAPDRRALSTAFSDREVAVDRHLTKCDATRSFAMTLPLTHGAKGETLRVHTQGFAAIFKGARARLTLKLNGQVKVKDFPVGSEDSFLQTLELPAVPATTYQLSGVVEVHQDPATGGTAYLNVLAIDAEIT